MKGPISWTGAALALLLLAGCYESTDVTMHDPGEFRGARDPLLDQPVAARSEQLQKRFQLVQVER